MNLGKELRTGIRLRIVNDPNISAVVKQNTLLTLAEMGGRKHLNVFRQFLKDDTLILPGMPDDKIQLRDMALCAAALVTGQRPKDYGFTVVIGEVPQHLFMAHNYRFTEGKGNGAWVGCGWVGSTPKNTQVATPTCGGTARITVPPAEAVGVRERHSIFT